MLLDYVFKALADPTRRRILHLLKEREQSAGELSKHFDISAPSMSHHFNVLKQADLISTRREGQQIIYLLNTSVFEDVLSVLFTLFNNQTNKGNTQPNQEENQP